MAFKLSESLRSQLNVNDSISNSRTNPSNLDAIQLPSGLRISRNYENFNQATADQRIDELTEQRERYVQGARVADAETATLKAYERLMNSLEKLATQCYKTEAAAAKAEVQIRTLSHQLVVLKKKLASEHAAKVEESNEGLISFERSLALKLQSITDTSKGGTSFGNKQGNKQGKGDRHLSLVA